MEATCRIVRPVAGILGTELLVRWVHRDPRYRSTVYRPTRSPHLHHPDDQMNYGRIQGRVSLELDASAVFFALLYLNLYLKRAILGFSPMVILSYACKDRFYGWRLKAR